MSSAVYFKFRASLKQYTIPFDGSSISVKDLKNSIKLQCGLKSTEFELEIYDKQGKEYIKDEELIPRYSDLIVRRVPKAADAPRKKIHNPEDMTRRDPYKTINSLPKINLLSHSMNLARANLAEDEKLEIVTRYSEDNTDKSYQMKLKPYGVPPPNYVCNKCHQGGHWIYECPGVRDKDGRYLDSKAIKRPTGIPQDFLLEVTAGTPGAYLTKEGKYMVPIKDAEAYALGKREKRPFSKEENPPLIEKDTEIPDKLKCPICKNLINNPTNTPCCQTIYCSKCIREFLYDPEINGNRECPKCKAVIKEHSLLLDNETVSQLITCYRAGLLTKEFIDECVRTPTIKAVPIKKTELLLNDKDSSNPSGLKLETATKTEGASPSSNTDLQNSSTSNVTETTPEGKVFVNNRRLLKPKASIKSEQDLSKMQSSNSQSEPSKPQVKSETTQSASLKVETKTTNQPLPVSSSDSAKSNVNKVTPIVKKEVDENDLIFGRVVDTGSTKSKQQISNQIKNESTNKSTVNSMSNDRFHDNASNQRSSHRYERRPHHYDSQRHNSSYNQRNNTGVAFVSNPSINSLDLAKTLQVFSSMIANPKPPGIINANNVLSNQPPQHAPISAIESMQFSLLNSMLLNQAHNNVNNPINLAALPNLVANGSIQNKIGITGPVGNAWKPSDPQNKLEYDVMGQPINSNISDLPNVTNVNDVNSYAKRLLSKQEFYEYQRRLRAEQLKRHSRSPSGSQSPIKRPRRDYRYSGSRYNYTHRRHRSRSHDRYKRNGDYYRSNEYKSPSPINTVHSRPTQLIRDHYHYNNRSQEDGTSRARSYRHEHHSQHNSGRSSSRHRQRRHPINDERQIDSRDLSSQLLSSNVQNDIKGIDQQLVQDSIKTFLNYLKGNNQTCSSDLSHISNHNSPEDKYDNTMAPDLDKYQSTSNNDQNDYSLASPRQITIARPFDNLLDDFDQTNIDFKDDTIDSSDITKKSKKSKKKSRNSDDDTSSKKKHKKHKKHKHKKSKKVKKDKHKSE